MAVLGLAEIRLILSARPGHRDDPAAPVEDRWRMLQLACESDPRLIPDETEIRRSGKSYTVTTLEDLRERYPDQHLCWVLGVDSFVTLPEWYRWSEVLRLCNLVVVERPGHASRWPAELVEYCQPFERAVLSDEPAGQLIRLNTPMLELSATQVRKAVRQGEPYEHLLPVEVSAYIKDHALYV